MLRRYTFRRVYTVHRSSGFDIVSINSSHCLGIHNGFLGEAWIYIIQSFVLKRSPLICSAKIAFVYNGIHGECLGDIRQKNVDTQYYRHLFGFFYGDNDLEIPIPLSSS